MVMRHQPVKGRLRPRLQLADQLGFISAPREGARPIGHALPFFSLPPLGAKDELAFFGRTLAEVEGSNPCPLLLLDTTVSGAVPGSSRLWHPARPGAIGP